MTNAYGSQFHQYVRDLEHYVSFHLTLYVAHGAAGDALPVPIRGIGNSLSSLTPTDIN